MAKVALATVEQVKQYLGINNENDDALLQRLVTSAGDWIQQWCNRNFGIDTYTDKFDGTGLYQYMFANYPVLSISQVMVNTVVVPAATSQNDVGYVFTDRRLILRDYNFAKGLLNCSVTYSAGFAEVPPEISQACVEICVHRYKERDRIGLTSKGLAGETIGFSQKDMPEDARTILTNYKKVIPS